MSETSLPPPDDSQDPELLALPTPRRPGRNLTLLLLGLNGALALVFLVALRTEVAYIFSGSQPADLGELGQLNPSPSQLNTWVRGGGQLGGPGLNYRRPLDPDRFRAAPLADNPKVWVELREPSDSDPAYFVPPASFVGRLTRLDDPGLLHRDVAQALRAQGPAGPPADAWLLIDAESPRSSRWLLGLMGLLLGFAGFSIFGLLKLAGLQKHKTLPIAKGRFA